MGYRFVKACVAVLLLLGLAGAHAQARAASLWINADAAYVLALRYEAGDGVPRDHARAFSLYCDADLLGHDRATFAIGWMYAHGEGVERDPAQAAAWLQRADLRGHPQASKLLRALPETAVVQPKCPDEPDEIDGAAEAASEAEIVQIVRTMAPFYGVDPELALAVIRVESQFRPNAVSHKNAHGLMQLRPATAARFGTYDLTDTISNLHGGLSYLRWLLDRFKGDVRLALAGYNAGERAVDRHRGVPPYRETRNYIKRISDEYPAMIPPLPPRNPLRPRSAS